MASGAVGRLPAGLRPDGLRGGEPPALELRRHDRRPTEPRRVYRVPRSKGYVQVIENGRAIMRLCLQPVECLPDADIVVLHKLMIEGNEEVYLQKANKYVCVD